MLSIAQSDRGRESIRYTALVASGVSATSARRMFGFERVPERVTCMDDAIAEAEAIRSAYDRVAKVQEKVTLAQFGVTYEDDTDSSSSSSDVEDDTEASERLSCHESVHHAKYWLFQWCIPHVKV